MAPYKRWTSLLIMGELALLCSAQVYCRGMTMVTCHHAASSWDICQGQRRQKMEQKMVSSLLSLVELTYTRMIRMMWGQVHIPSKQEPFVTSCTNRRIQSQAGSDIIGLIVAQLWGHLPPSWGAEFVCGRVHTVSGVMLRTPIS